MGLNRNELARLSGLSYRQLDYWHRAGALVGHSGGSGVACDYGHRDLMAARMLARVSKAFGGNVPVHLVIRVVDAVSNDGELAPLTVDLGHDVSLRIGVDMSVRTGREE